MKRFTATEKWSDPWFRKLPPRLKAFWMYLCDQCDCGGVWQADYELASFSLGEDVTEEDLAKYFGDRCATLKNGRVFISKFVEFQYGKVLNPANSAHRGAIKAMEDAQPGLSKSFEAPPKDLPSPLQGAQDKDKDKDQAQTPEDEGPGETNLSTEGSAPDTDPELSVDEIVGGIHRIFRTDRRPGGEALHAIAEAMPIKASELADLERFYAEPESPQDARLARCQTPKNLALDIANQLVKARDFYGRKRGRPGGSGNRPAVTSLPSDWPQFKAFLCQQFPRRADEIREWTTWEQAEAAMRGARNLYLDWHKKAAA